MEIDDFKAVSYKGYFTCQLYVMMYRIMYCMVAPELRYVPYREKMYHCSPNSAPLLQEMTCNVSEQDIGKTTP